MVVLVGAVVSSPKDYHYICHHCSTDRNLWVLWVFTDPPINGVSCGGHSAPTCAECPQGNGAVWCNGQCGWDYTNSVCFKPGKSLQVLQLKDY